MKYNIKKWYFNLIKQSRNVFLGHPVYIKESEKLQPEIKFDAQNFLDFNIAYHGQMILIAVSTM